MKNSLGQPQYNKQRHYCAKIIPMQTPLGITPRAQMYAQTYDTGHHRQQCSQVQLISRTHYGHWILRKCVQYATQFHLNVTEFCLNEVLKCYT